MQGNGKPGESEVRPLHSLVRSFRVVALSPCHFHRRTHNLIAYPSILVGSICIGGIGAGPDGEEAAGDVS